MKKIFNLQKEKGSQIGVLIISSTKPETIEEYSIKVAENWKLGRKGIDDGVLFVIALKDRKMRIEVGYGLEGAIPDAKAKQILEDFVKPYFKEKDYYKGIYTGVNMLEKLIRGEPLPEPTKSLEFKDSFQPVPFILHLIAWLALGDFKKWKTIIVIIADICLILFFTFLFASFKGAFEITAILLWMFYISMKRKIGYGKFYYGGPRYWRSSSRRFSGGGGSFGGGGASSSW